MWLFFLVYLPSVDFSVNLALDSCSMGTVTMNGIVARYQSHSLLTEVLLLCIVWGAAL